MVSFDRSSFPPGRLSAAAGALLELRRPVCQETFEAIRFRRWLVLETKRRSETELQGGKPGGPELAYLDFCLAWFLLSFPSPAVDGVSPCCIGLQSAEFVTNAEPQQEVRESRQHRHRLILLRAVSWSSAPEPAGMRRPAPQRREGIAAKREGPADNSAFHKVLLSSIASAGHNRRMFC